MATEKQSPLQWLWGVFKRRLWFLRQLWRVVLLVAAHGRLWYFWSLWQGQITVQPLPERVVFDLFRSKGSLFLGNDSISVSALSSENYLISKRLLFIIARAGVYPLTPLGVTVFQALPSNSAEMVFYKTQENVRFPSHLLVWQCQPPSQLHQHVCSPPSIWRCWLESARFPSRLLSERGTWRKRQNFRNDWIEIDKYRVWLFLMEFSPELKLNMPKLQTT